MSYLYLKNNVEVVFICSTRFGVKILRIVFVGLRGELSFYSSMVRVAMDLTEAMSTPSTLTNREMSYSSEEGARVIRRASFKPGNLLDLPSMSIM
jgi:hypothetical protein